MSEERTTGEIGDVVELADKTAGFTDAETGFDLSRDQQKELTDPLGSSTQQAIVSGRLLIVGRSKASAKAENDADAAAKAEADAKAKADAEAAAKSGGTGK